VYKGKEIFMLKFFRPCWS